MVIPSVDEVLSAFTLDDPLGASDEQLTAVSFLSKTAMPSVTKENTTKFSFLPHWLAHPYRWHHDMAQALLLLHHFTAYTLHHNDSNKTIFLWKKNTEPGQIMEVTCYDWASTFASLCKTRQQQDSLEKKLALWDTLIDGRFSIH